MIIDWNKIAKHNVIVIMRLSLNKLRGCAIMCDNELSRNSFHCVVTENSHSPRPPPPGHVVGMAQRSKIVQEIMYLMHMKMFTLILGRMWIFPGTHILVLKMRLTIV